MSDMLIIAGCKRLTDKILENMRLFAASSMANDYNSAKGFAAKIAYDAENLKSFIPETTCPDWINNAIVKCREFARLGNLSSGDFSKPAMVIQEIWFELRNFSWDQWASQYDYIDLDKEFSKEAAARHLDSAIDRLIDCLNIISNDPEFNLSRQTTIDIQALVSNLQKSKNSSHSAIRSWLCTAFELVKLCVPHMDKMEKGVELLKKTQAAFDEACFIVNEVSQAVVCNLKNKFCLGDKIIHQNIETAKLSLPLGIESDDKQ